MMKEQIGVLQNKVKQLLKFPSFLFQCLWPTYFPKLNACLVNNYAVARSTRLETYAWIRSLDGSGYFQALSWNLKVILLCKFFLFNLKCWNFLYCRKQIQMWWWKKFRMMVIYRFPIRWDPGLSCSVANFS